MLLLQLLLHINGDVWETPISVRVLYKMIDTTHISEYEAPASGWLTQFGSSKKKRWLEILLFIRKFQSFVVTVI